MTAVTRQGPPLRAGRATSRPSSAPTRRSSPPAWSRTAVASRFTWPRRFTAPPAGQTAVVYDGDAVVGAGTIDAVAP